jgi:serine/threonine protein kinase
VPPPSLDLWALTIVLVEAIGGRHPWAPACDTSIAERIRDIDPVDLCSSLEVSPSLRAFIERALAPNPQRRFATAADFAARLETLSRG